MKLIFLYGPPAAGKLTVAKELEKITGYKLLHNHLVRDIVEVVIDKSSPIFSPEKNKMYLHLLTLAAKAKTSGIIFTFYYNHPRSEKFVKQLIKNVPNHGGKIYFVRITCHKSELFKRVGNKSRKKFKKIISKKYLNNLFDEKNFYFEIPYVKNLNIDNTNLKPKDAARMIAKYCKINIARK
jgi:tRNA uridine 5-carbamoylmethylation protein Kti12